MMEKFYPVPGFESDDPQLINGVRPLADAWYWQIDNRWIAVVDAWERETWWEGSGDAEVAMRPDNWHRLITDVPTTGTLVYCVLTDECNLQIVERELK